MSYSRDLRKRVVNSVIEENNSMRSVSKTFSVHYNTVKIWVKRFLAVNNLVMVLEYFVTLRYAL